MSFPGIQASNYRSQMSGMLFFIPIHKINPFPTNGECDVPFPPPSDYGIIYEQSLKINFLLMTLEIFIYCSSCLSSNVRSGKFNIEVLRQNSSSGGRKCPSSCSERPRKKRGKTDIVCSFIKPKLTRSSNQMFDQIQILSFQMLTDIV